MEILSGDFSKGQWKVSRGQISSLMKIVPFNGNTVASVTSQGPTKSKDHSGTLGSAFIGGAFLGPLGAVGGALVSGRNRDGVIVQVIMRDGKQFLSSCTHDEFKLLLSSQGGKDSSKSIVDRIVNKDLRPVTEADGHQRLFGFVYQYRKKGQNLELRLYDNRLEWDVVLPGVKPKKPNFDCIVLPLSEVTRIEIAPAPGEEYLLRVHQGSKHTDFLADEYNSRIFTKTYEDLINDSNLSSEAHLPDEGIIKPDMSVEDDDIVSKMEKLDTLRQKALITDKEFEQKKKDLLEGL